MQSSICVSPEGGQWSVHCRECDSLWTYSTRDIGVAAARHHVAHHRAGAVRQIVVRRPDGQVQEEWTHGRDGYPPPG
jgi:hypothetical protein